MVRVMGVVMMGEVRVMGSARSVSVRVAVEVAAQSSLGSAAAAIPSSVLPTYSSSSVLKTCSSSPSVSKTCSSSPSPTSCSSSPS